MRGPISNADAKSAYQPFSSALLNRCGISRAPVPYRIVGEAARYAAVECGLVGNVERRVWGRKSFDQIGIGNVETTIGYSIGAGLKNSRRAAFAGKIPRQDQGAAKGLFEHRCQLSRCGRRILLDQKAVGGMELHPVKFGRKAVADRAGKFAAQDRDFMGQEGARNGKVLVMALRVAETAQRGDRRGAIGSNLPGRSFGSALRPRWNNC